MDERLFTRVLHCLEERRDRVLNGLLNCVPLAFSRFKRVWPGVERSRYYMISANQKIGKSKLGDFIFVYEPFFYMMRHPDQIRVKVLYFTLEIDKKEKFCEFLCHLLFRLSGGEIRVSTTDLKSTDSDRPVKQEILDLLQTEEYQKYIKAFEECVEFIDDIKNPTGINKYCRGYAMEHGKLHFTKKIRKDEFSGDPVEYDAIDYYEPDDPEEYRIIMLDNASNLTKESNMNLMDTITKMSKYFITLRDQLGFTPVLIQHQNQAQEGIENIKLDKLKPSANGLADCKTTIRDINTAIGLYSPFKYGLREYEGYDITKFKNNIRFMEIMEDRDNGAGGMICPLYFDGATSFFAELPRANDITGLQEIYNLIAKNRNEYLMILFHLKKKSIVNTFKRFKAKCQKFLF